MVSLHFRVMPSHMAPEETIYFTSYTSKYPSVSDVHVYPWLVAEDVLRSRDISELQEKLDASESELRDEDLGKWQTSMSL